MAKESEITYWKNQIRICQDYMKPRHRMWRQLLKRYELDFPSDSVEEKSDIIRKSSMYPIARQVRASVAFNYPKYAITVEEDKYSRSAEILTRAANKAIRLMKARREVQQQTFDTLFCGVSWGKYTFNPKGDNAEPPYVANDELHEDFVAYTRVNPFCMFVDPLCPPHRFGDARYTLECMTVPMEFLEMDDRYDKRAIGKLKTMQGDTAHDDDILGDLEDAVTQEEEEDRKAKERSMSDGRMVEIWEISDRLHGERLVLSMGCDTFLEKDLHPFLKVTPVLEEDDFGNQFQTGFEPTGGYLVQGGFPYSPLKIDGSVSGFYPVPSMEYIKDLEQMQVEGLTRRHDLTKRYPRVVLANQSELDANPALVNLLKNAQDGTVIGVLDASAFQEVPWGNPPQDQLNLQREAQQAEGEVLRVSESAGTHSKTATEASFAASAGAVNREWFKQAVVDLYAAIAKNTLSIFSDARYTPKAFTIQAIADAGGPQEAQIILSQADFLLEYNIEVDAESIQPLAAQRDRDNIIALSDRLMPHTDIVDKRHILELLAERFGVRNTDALFTKKGDVVTQKLLQMENQQLAQGQDPSVLPDEDHLAHVQAHQEAMQQAVQQISIPPGPGVTPQLVQQQQQAIRQVFEQHIASHQQNLGQAAALLNGGSPSGAGTAGNNSMIDQVRSNAQDVSNHAQSNARQDIGT